MFESCGAVDTTASNDFTSVKGKQAMIFPQKTNTKTKQETPSRPVATLSICDSCLLKRAVLIRSRKGTSVSARERVRCGVGTLDPFGRRWLASEGGQGRCGVLGAPGDSQQRGGRGALLLENRGSGGDSAVQSSIAASLQTTIKGKGQGEGEARACVEGHARGTDRIVSLLFGSFPRKKLPGAHAANSGYI